MTYEKCYMKVLKAFKKVPHVLESVRKSLPVKNPHHAETIQSTRNANKLTKRKQNVSAKPEGTSKQTRVP